MPDQNTWDYRFLNLAHHISLWSKDPSTKSGAVVVGKTKRQVAIGFNGFPPQIPDDPAFLADRELKYRYTMHAERNALDNATFDVEGGTLYVTFPPCHECAKSMISRGIKRVVMFGFRDAELEKRWGETAKIAISMLEGAGVTVIVKD